jgi:hypothetical protein
MAVLPNMGITTWPNGSDNFSFSVFANNWQLVDDHDHTAGKGLQIPSNGIANSAITSAKIAAGAVTDDKLASPSSSVWRSVLVAASGTFDNNTGSETLGHSGDIDGGYKFFTVPELAVGSTGVPLVPYLFRYISADHDIAGKTTQFRLRAAIGANSVAAGVTFDFSLRPLTAYSGAADNMSFTVGSVIASSVATINAAALTSTISYATSSTFSLTTATSYIPGFNITGAYASGAATHHFVWLDMRHV